MTLSTYMVIAAEENVPALAEEAYQICRRLLDTPDDYYPERDTEGDIHEIDHQPGLGLDAWLLTKHRPAGVGPIPYVPGPDVDPADDWEREYHESDPFVNGTASIQINWDTSYGGHSSTGEGCSALHARYIATLGAWADERGLDWWWKNEFTGEWFKGTAGLKEFSPSFETNGAKNWFVEVVTPALAAIGVTVDPPAEG
jgi:hypothetical protein